MALQVWLPLNGNLNNQGLGNIPINGNAEFTTGFGKVSNVYASSGDFSFTVPSITNKKELTFMFWAYIDSSLVTSDWTRIAYIIDTGTNSGSNMRFEVCPKTSHDGIYCFSNHNNVNYGLTTGCIVSPIGGYYDQWVHFCFTSDGNTFKRYMNGEYIGSCQYNGTATFSGEFRLYNNNICHKQDVRVYDNCLSPREIKEIAKGMVCHYPMGNVDGYIVGRNLITNSDFSKGKWVVDVGNMSLIDDTSFNKKIASFTVSGSCNRIYGEVSNVWTNGATYTVSFYAKSSLSGASIRPSRSLADFGSWISLTTEWKRYYATIDCTATVSGGTLSFDVNNTSATYYITNIKLEKGSTATPWTPAPEDNQTLYSDKDVVYDVSGFGNNGSITGNVIGSNDTPRYMNSYYFNLSPYITVPPLTLNMNNITFSIWFKLNSYNDWQRIFDFGIQPSGKDTAFGMAISWKKLYVFGKQSGGDSLPDNDICEVKLNTWYHVCCVVTDSAFKVYMNGTVAKTGSFNKAIGTVNFTLNNLAKSNWAVDPLLDGYLSDFRIYATALSEEDVKDLYTATADKQK